jgi:hypothetical protein
MSSATSTKDAASPDLSPAGAAVDNGLRPWQFFVLAGLGCATVVTWVARAQGITAVLLLTILMGAVALAALATLRTVSPLVSPEEDRTPMVGERTRAALEREKMLTLRAIKELEFDRAMKKVSEDDFKEMSSRLRARASRLIRQLDAGGGYRDRIEKDLAKRLGDRPADATALAARAGASAKDDVHPAAAVKSCGACATVNDADARFCKGCGAKL